MPGGFDHFKSEFHRLHTEILATQVPDAITPRELNGIVREKIRNPTVWQLAYGEAHNGPLNGHIPIAANNATATGKEFKGMGAKRSLSTPRDPGGKFQKTQRTSNTETFSKSTSSTTYSTPTPDKRKSRRETKCTRCWQSNTNHNYRNCTANKCICGQTLTADQLICFNYDNHSANAKFTESVPKTLARIFDAYKRLYHHKFNNCNFKRFQEPRCDQEQIQEGNQGNGSILSRRTQTQSLSHLRNP